MATYQAELNQIVQVTTNTEANTITAPVDPSDGHWFEVKLRYPYSGFITTIATPGLEAIEDLDGKGPSPFAEMVLPYERARWVFIDGTWWVLGISRPHPIPELFDKEAGSLLLGTDTPIPLAYDTGFEINPTYFSINGGNIECIRPFAGSITTRAYFEMVFTANNQDAMGVVDLYAVSGTPTINQGYGIAAAFQASRAGTWYMSGVNSSFVIASVNDIIGLRGNNDPGQSGETYVIENTGLIAQAI